MASDNEQEQPQGHQRPTTNTQLGGGLNRDVMDTFTKGTYSHARNATIVLPDGQTGPILHTESANILEVLLPYTLIGAIQVHADVWWLFSTDNTTSEIGEYIEGQGTYTTKLNDTATLAAGLPGMNFSTSHLIIGAARRNFDCGFDIYWSDGGHNVDRMIDTQFMYPNPWVQSCTTVASCITCVNTNKIDVEQLRLSPQFTVPCLKLAKSRASGQLPNGSYQVAMRFAINSIPCTAFVALSNVHGAFTHVNDGSALVLTISGINTETTVIFPEMEIVVISMVNQQVQAKRLGVYDSTQQTIYIDNIHQELITIDLKLLPISNPIIDKSDAIYSVSNYLIRVGTYEKPEFNYQPLANQIIANWVMERREGNYYHAGRGSLDGSPMDVGYLRGEVYALFIRWVYTTGDKSASYHIPGLPGGTAPTMYAGGNTGRFGGYSSTEKYPDNEPTIWGALCGQPIRHHMFPDQTFGGPSCPLSHFDTTGNIYIMGIYLTNIPPPVDNVGNLIPNIQGYEILRATRDGGDKSILAKGQINHMRGYLKDDGTIGLYQNYPYDDLGPDRYLTTSQTIGTVGGSVDGFQGNEASIVMDNIATFHSPDTTFENPYLGQGTLTMDMFMSGTATGSFDTPYRHPKFKLLTDRATFFGILVASLGVFMQALNAAGGGTTNLALSATETIPWNTSLGMGAIAEGSGGLLGDATFVAAEAATLIAIGILAPFQVRIIQEQIMNVLNGLAPPIQFARQYDSHGFYNIPHWTPGYQFALNDYQYIKGHLSTFGNFDVNNLYRNPYVAVNINGKLPDFPAPFNYTPLPGGVGNYAASITWAVSGTPPVSCDRSRFTLGQGPNSPYPPGPRSSLGPFLSPIVSWYGSYKVPNAAQYGQVDSPKQVPISCIQVYQPVLMSTRSLWGGDTYINRYTEKNTMLFFNDWLVDAPPDYQYDYTTYENVPYPRYWINNSKVYSDFWQQASRNWHVDEPDLGTVIFGAGLSFYLKGGYFYLFNNGTRDFFVESEVNVGYRDWEDVESKRFYDPYTYTNLAYLYRSDIIKSDPFYKYDYSLSASRFWNQYLSWSKCLDRDYSPILAYTCNNYYPRRLAYSLPQEEELKKDNWKVFLPNNYKDMPDKVICIKDINKTGALILMQNQAPQSFTGVEAMPSKSGTEYTIGTGELFRQALQSITNVDDSYQYGSCQNRLAIVSTPYGVIWASQNTGKIFHYAPSKTYYNQGESMVDIATHGLKYDLSLYMPSQLLKQFPDYALYDNPVAGIGMQLIYDNTNDILYVCKKDYQVIPSILSKVSIANGGWSYNTGFVDMPIKLGDPLYFIDCSWTLSYDLKGKKFISFHDWHPALNIPAKTHFLTTETSVGIGNQLWRHNKVTNLYCNYYNQSYPFEIEYPITTGNGVTTLENLEVFLESYNWKTNQVDRFHQYDGFFNQCLIRNSEQATPMLLMQLKPWDDPFAVQNFPFFSAAGLNVFYTKQEQKYRIGMGIRDYTDDRGEFDVDINQLIQTNPNWYTFNLSPVYYDFTKSWNQLKKIRHYKSRVFLRRSIVGNNSMSIYFANSVNTNSPR